MNNKIRRQLNNLIAAIRRIFLTLVLWLQEVSGLANWYHPNPFKTKKNSVARESVDRLNAIKPYLPSGPYTVMDIGCQEGYFLFKLSDDPGLKLGIDVDRNALQYGTSLASIQDKQNVVFSYSFIKDPSDLDVFPDFDVIICMSIYHHWAKHFGEIKANELLRKISHKTKKLLIFDTGEPSELTQAWAKKLDFLSPSVENYFSEKLVTYGFSKVLAVGKSNTNLGSTKRNLFIAQK